MNPVVSENKTINILYIEDNLLDFLLVKRLLNRSKTEEDGYKLEQVDRLSKGLERLSQGGITIVLTDLNLPDSSELEAISSLHSQFPTVPIIALTSAYSYQLGLDAVRQGAQDYLLKDDLTEQMIKHSIRYAIERNQMGTMKHDFANTLSKEIAAPITYLKESINRLKTMVAGPLTAKQQEMLSSMQESIDHIESIIKNLSNQQ